jgi:hypothetical protein
MLRRVGFARVRVVTPPPSMPYRVARAVSHAIRGRNRFGLALHVDRVVVHAWKR